MANISILSRLVNGAQRNVDLSSNTLVVDAVKFGGGAGTDLTKTILDKLILINAAADADGTFDTRYAQLSALTGKANTNLSNLAVTTAVNSSILPADDASIDLGSPSKRWQSIRSLNVYTNGLSGNSLTIANNLFVGFYNTNPDGQGGQTSTLTASGSQDLNLVTDAGASAAASVKINLLTGNTVNGNSGDVKLRTGVPTGTGIRGKISLDGLEIDVNSKKITNLATPVAGTDATNKTYVDTAITNASGSATNISYSNATSGLTASNVQTAIDEVEGRLDATETVANAAIPLSQKGANSGVATLDAGGKIPASQLPNTVMEYQGVYNATTNSPALTNGGAHSSGDVYRVSVAGTQNFGAGNITLEIGDLLIYSGSVWEKSDSTDNVTSVNGLQGTVVLTTSDIAEGSNLYFTDGRAQTAVISQVITNGVTTKAPSEDAVFDALAGKANTALSNLGTTAITQSLLPASAVDLGQAGFGWNMIYADGLRMYGAIQAYSGILMNGANVEQVGSLKLLGGGQVSISANPSTTAHNLVLPATQGAANTVLTNNGSGDLTWSPLGVTSSVAGEAFAATTLFAVRYALAADSGFVAGRIYKADNNAASADNFYVIGLARPTTLLAATDSISVVKSGTINVPSHGFTPGVPLFLSTSGAVTATAPTAANSAVVRVGIAVDANNIEVQMQVIGVN